MTVKGRLYSCCCWPSFMLPEGLASPGWMALTATIGIFMGQKHLVIRVAICSQNHPA